jgi:hypothetical protein
MLDWLKTILGDAYSEGVDKKISTEIAKGFVIKSDYNQLSETKKSLEGVIAKRDKQLETLKAASGDSEALKKQIETLQGENKTAADTIKDLQEKHTAELTERSFQDAVKSALTKAGAKNHKAAIALLDDKLDDLRKSKDPAADIECSPRYAGNTFRREVLRLRYRDHPRYAGNTPAQRIGSSPSWDHPPHRGEHIHFLSFTS